MLNHAFGKIFSFLSFQDMRTFVLDAPGVECKEVELVHKLVREYDAIKNVGPWTGSIEACVSTSDGERHVITTSETVCHGSVNPLLFAFKESIIQATASQLLRFSDVTLSFTKITADRP